MPLLLNVLRNANGVEHKKLRWKAMECAGLIGTFGLVIGAYVLCIDLIAAIAVGRDMFRADAGEFVELLMRIQSISRQSLDSPVYLIARFHHIAYRQPRRSRRHDAHPLPHCDVGKSMSSDGARVRAILACGDAAAVAGSQREGGCVSLG